MAVVAHHLHDVGAVLLQLHFAHAWHIFQFVQRHRQLVGNSHESLLVHDGECRHPCLLGHDATPCRQHRHQFGMTHTLIDLLAPFTLGLVRFLKFKVHLDFLAAHYVKAIVADMFEQMLLQA